MLRSFLIGLIIMFLGSPAWALYGISFGNQPVTDQNWPDGSLALANLPTRYARATGDPGNSIFAYHGDTAAFQTAIDLLAKLNAPEVRLIVHGGANPSSMFSHVPPLAGAGMSERLLSDVRNNNRGEDWTFTVFNPIEFDRRQKMLGDLIPAYAMPSPAIDVFLDKASNIDFSAIKVPRNIKMTDERGGASGVAGSTIRGQVLDMLTSKPITDALIVLLKSNPETHKWESASQTKSDPDGAFEFKNVPSSAYRLNVSASGHATRIADYIQILDSTSKQTEVQLAPVVTIKGKVIDTDGAPVAGVTVTRRGSVGPDKTSYDQPEDGPAIMTDARGNFSLSVPPGTTRLHATLDGYYNLDWRGPTTAPADAATLHMIRSGTIKGTVVDRLGNPARGNAMVKISGTPSPLGWGEELSMMPDGVFEFKNVPPGAYLVSTGPSPDVANDPNALMIQVKSGETTEVTVQQRARVTEAGGGGRRISPIP